MNSKYLAIDLGRVSAAAWSTPDGVESEHVVLGRAGDVPGHLIALEQWIDGLILRASPCHVYVERHTGRGAGSRTLDAYTHVVVLAAARHGVPCRTRLSAVSARKLALGRGIARTPCWTKVCPTCQLCAVASVSTPGHRSPTP